ncbi:unnamed protein product [Anisakis simplex]|uniref:F-BAR domain-containing protein n=1 Tax=Anisakis simplex TaxID=6269 RepID=A0A0M3K3J4_ANISI|nr:unnamed protein product [Anisakis simplex]
MNDIEAQLCDLGNFTIFQSFEWLQMRKVVKEMDEEATKLKNLLNCMERDGITSTISLLQKLTIHSWSSQYQDIRFYSGILRKRIETQLERAVHRMAQFEATAVKYERIVENLEVKENSSMKSCLRAAQARKVVKGMDEEAKKLKNLLNCMQRDGIISKDTASDFVK